MKLDGRNATQAVAVHSQMKHTRMQCIASMRLSALPYSIDDEKVHTAIVAFKTMQTEQCDSSTATHIRLVVCAHKNQK